MNEKDLFPDYEPKLSPDTIYDYLKNPTSFVFEILTEIGEPLLEKLKIIIKYFKKYEVAAEKNPGKYQPGNIIIGADPNQYYPSEEELLLSELGKMVKLILNSNSIEKVDSLRKLERIKSHTLEFNEIVFRHVDVMGSGRFFYADKKDPKIKLEL
ncbi:MAG: hypothetical protein ACFFCV_18315 [Promethearchaeota archaeon]